jgi:hypothetical protein
VAHVVHEIVCGGDNLVGAAMDFDPQGRELDIVAAALSNLSAL